MLLGLRALGSALGQVLTHVSASVLGNVLAVILSTPLLLLIGVLAYSVRSFSLIPLGVAFLLGVLPSPCSAGVQFVASKLASGDFVTIHDQWLGLRSYAPLAAATWLVSLLVSFLLLANVVFYARSVGTTGPMLHAVAVPLLLVWLLLFAIWVAMHLYVFPLIIAQEVKNLRLIYKNAALMVIARPAVSVTVTIFWLVILLLCSATGLSTFIGIALGAAIQQNAAARVLPTFRMQPAA